MLTWVVGGVVFDHMHGVIWFYSVVDSTICHVVGDAVVCHSAASVTMGHKNNEVTPVYDVIAPRRAMESRVKMC